MTHAQTPSPGHLEIIPVTPSLRSRASSERSEGSGSREEEILRCAQDDSQDTTHVRSREVFSPNVWPAPPVRLLLLSKDASCIITFEKRQIERNHTLWQPFRQRAKTNTLLTLKMPRKWHA